MKKKTLPKDFIQTTIVCDRCHGSGEEGFILRRDGSNPCPRCKGTRVIAIDTERERLRRSLEKEWRRQDEKIAKEIEFKRIEKERY